MPNVARVLKEEIQRLARKETRAVTVDLRKAVTKLRHDLAKAKQQIAKLETASRRLGAQRSKTATAAAKAANAGEDVKVERARITGKIVARIRKRLGLSQNEFGALVGATGQSVYQWERNEGRLTFRGGTKAGIVAAREMGKREARQRLDAMGITKKSLGRAAKKSAQKPAKKSGRKSAKKSGKKPGRKSGR